VFVYSIANFPTLRCLEQIRNDVCYHQVPVTVVSVGAGLAYGTLGFSHHALQDLAVMRALPNLRVLSPADPGECRECVQLIVSDPKPTYLRLGKAGESDLHEVRGVASGPLCIRAGRSGFAIAATGSILKPALAAAELLSQRGVDVSVYSCPMLTGVAEDFFAPLWKHPRLLSVEEHCRPGGFGSLLRELAPSDVRVQIQAIDQLDFSEVGSQDYLRERAGLTPANIADTAFAEFSRS
jgi:transketolase